MNKRKIWSILLSFAIVVAMVFAVGGILSADTEPATVTLKSGTGSGDDIVFSTDNSAIVTNRTSEWLRFMFLKTDDGWSFKLDRALPSTFSSPERYPFVGWDVAENYTDTVLNLKPGDNIVVTAVWRPSGECGADGSLLLWRLESNGMLRIGGYGNMVNYTSSDPAPWYNFRDQITQVGLADTVTSIGDYAFCGFTGLTDFIIPSNITYIGKDAFYDCTNISDVYCYANPANLTWDDGEYNDFRQAYNYEDMTRLHVLDGFWETGHIYANVNIFNDLYRAEGSCGDNVTWGIDGNYKLYIWGKGDMTDYASAGSTPWCKYAGQIKEIEIEYSVTSIGDYAFADLTNLEKVDYWRSKQDFTIGAYAFKGCSSLKKFNNNSTDPTAILYATSIGDGAFEGCSSLPEIHLAAKTTYIGADAFKNCTGFTEFSIPANVTYIGEDAFKGCTNISLVNCYANPADIETWADAESDDFMDSGVTKCYVASKYYNGFCANFGHVNISFASHKIDNGGSCGDNATYYIDGDGTLYVNGTGPMKDYSVYYDAPWYNYKNLVTGIVIAEGITTVGNQAFREFNNLLTVEIPSTITSIGDWGFGNCFVLQPLTIPSTVRTIGDYAFSSVNFDSITISDGVESIGDYAFSNTFLKSVTIPASVTTIGEHSFEYSLLESVTILGGVREIPYQAFAGCKYLDSVTLADSVETIGNSAFTRSGLTSVDFLDGVETIEDFAFASCDDLKSVTISGSVKSIGEMSFYENSNLETVTIEPGLLEIGREAFHESAITSITIPGSVETIGKSAFVECYYLTNVTILDGVKKIDEYAFSGCEQLTTVTIPASVKYIGEDAFWDCTKVSDVYCYAVPDDDFEWPERDFNDFCRNVSSKTKCHVCSEYLQTYHDRFYYTVNVDFVGDLVPSIGEELKGYSLSLEGDIAVNFYMDLDEALASSDTAKVVFTISSLDGSKTRTQTVYVKPQSQANRTSAYIEDGYYVFKCKVAAKEMTSVISAQMVDGKSKGNKYEYSVQQYAKYILDHYYVEKYEKAQDIVKAMLNYGAYSQLYFNYNLENLAYTALYEYEREVSIIDVSELRAFSGSTSVGSGGLKLKSANLELESETVLNLYFTGVEGYDHLNFKLDDGTGDDKVLPCKFSDDGTGKTIARVSIKNIPAQYINNDFKVDVYEGTAFVGTITYSPMYYCYNVISREITATRTEALKLNISAYILFYQKASEYVRAI
ncbi:MAG: leucine-rich repeat domain-containing protein [Saccharofermentans sp.]|nr:leucine-rich repeat domain-containing protein [Saccharofermentans sp.]